MFLTDLRPDFWGLRPIAGCWLASAVPLGSGWLREADWRSERRPQRARQHNPQPRHNLTNHYPPQPRPNQSTPISYQGITSQTITPHNQVTTHHCRLSAISVSNKLFNLIFSKSVFCQLYQLLLEASGFVKSSIFISNEILLRLLWSDSPADFIKWVGDPDYVSFCCCDAFILNSLFHFNFAKRLNFLIALPLFQSPFKGCTNQL